MSNYKTYIPKEIAEEIKSKSTLEQILNQYHNLGKKKGSSYEMHCNNCKGEGRLKYTPTKKIAKCFKCDVGVKTPISYLMKFHGHNYTQALEELAQLNFIEIPKFKEKDKTTTKRKLKTAAQKAKKEKTFCETMLENSGLAKSDITDQDVFMIDNTRKSAEIYKSGSVDEKFQKVRGDDVIIDYYDLEGKQMTYYELDRSGNPKGKPKPFFRVRFQHPDLNQDKNGNPVKYKSPYGSGTKLYIPKCIRRKYKMSSKIKTLYIQEGEKKADKACKHGIISVGVMGIHNMANNKKLPAEFERIIKRCQVENIVFVLDQDCFDLSSKIDSKHSADQRPKSFYRAVVNFRDYFAAFKNSDIYLNIFFGHIKPNNENDKGIDDLLTNSLRGKEDELAKLCDKALIEPKGDATWLQFHKITTVSEFKIKEFWALENKDAFVAKYFDTLKDVPEFVFGKQKWRIDENKECVLAQPLMDSEQFWNGEERKDKKGNIISTNYTFNHKRCYNFLQNRGFFRIEKFDGTFSFVHLQDNILREVKEYKMKDFVIDFTKQLNMEDVENMLYRNAKNYLGLDSLSNLEFRTLELNLSKRNLQYMYFNDKYWRISDEEIVEEELKNLEGQVWEDSILDFKPEKLDFFLKDIQEIGEKEIKKVPGLKDFKGEYLFEIMEEGQKCDFLQFLCNTSDFFHENKTRKLENYSIAEKLEINRHLLSKLTAMGYLLHNYRDAACEKAVICMDGMMSAVGESNGRSGKSLFGVALDHIIKTVYISGKKKDLTEDRFIWEEVNERTQNVILDDIRANMDFERFFPEITGNFQIEGKGNKKYTLPKGTGPKLLFSTNHALKGEGGSFDDRQILLGFSDWYNSNHKPVDDFGVLFFQGWCEKQWNRFYNLMAQCLHLYFKYGIIEGPKEALMKRKLRQDIGETFLDWADEFFYKEATVNSAIPKEDMFNGDNISLGKGFLTKYPDQKKYTNIRTFKKKLKQYCIYKEFEFNPKQNGKDDKRSGTEYITVNVPDEMYFEIAQLNK
ncbi:CHC2 zinc finger domain-containing protein [Aureivirga marina]|uniref:CHC2 zinc finger domain-containing protein n=1 Tax=Aureivirga marina TaxID=1182451 RepID=UPI0018CA85B0|nr:CHC2 zinc finger domain-containing protein [Aureivirga marina]